MIGQFVDTFHVSTQAVVCYVVMFITKQLLNVIGGHSAQIWVPKFLQFFGTISTYVNQLLQILVHA